MRGCIDINPKAYMYNSQFAKNSIVPLTLLAEFVGSPEITFNDNNNNNYRLRKSKQFRKLSLGTTSRKPKKLPNRYIWMMFVGFLLLLFSRGRHYRAHY